MFLHKTFAVEQIRSETHQPHGVARRIETHVRICVLALLVERVAEIACQQPWPQIRRQLQKLQVTENIEGQVYV